MFKVRNTTHDDLWLEEIDQLINPGQVVDLAEYYYDEDALDRLADELDTTISQAIESGDLEIVERRPTRDEDEDDDE